MTVLRAALLFDHPTTRLFASRILESSFFFFCFLILLLLHHLARSFLLDPSSRSSRVYPRYFSVTVPPLRIPPPFPLPGSCTLVPPQPPSIEVLCKQTHESERRIEGFPCPLIPPLLLLLLLFLVSSPATLLTFAKLSEWLRWEKRRVHSRMGMGLSDHTSARLLRRIRNPSRSPIANTQRYHLHIDI